MRVWDTELLSQKGASIVTDNLLVNFDALDFVSYPGSIVDPITRKTISPFVQRPTVHKLEKVGNALSVSCISTTTATSYIDITSAEELSGISCVDFTFRAASSSVIDSNIRFGTYISSVISSGPSNNRLVFDGVMHHYTLNSISPKIYVYVDGVQTIIAADNKPPYDASTFLTIYCAYRTVQHLFDIGSIRIYSAPLTEEQILINHAYEQSIGRVS